MVFTSSLRDRLAGLAINRPETLAVFAIITLVAAGLVYFRLQNLTEAAAYYGFSASGLANPVWLLPTFAEDFPNGMANLLKSLPMTVYPIAGQLGIDGRTVFAGMVVAEIIVLICGSFIAGLTINKQAGLTAIALSVLYLFAGQLLNSSLARWWHPYFGTVYNFAYGFGLAGTALAIAGQLKRGGAALGLSIAIHPTLGLFFGAFAALAILADIRRYRWRDLAAGACIAAVIGGVWLFITLANAGVSGGSVPADQFIAITRVMGHHWYPISFGVFADINDQSFIPFLSFCLLLAVYLFDGRERLSGMDRQLSIAMAFTLVATVIGVFLAEYSGNPLIVKIAPHRACFLVLLFGTFFIVPGLWRDACEGVHWRAALAIALLIFPFFIRAGVPAVWALALAGPLFLISARQNPWGQRTVVIGLAIATLVAAFCLIIAQDHFAGVRNNAYTGANALMSWQAIVMVAACALFIAWRREPLIALAAIGLAALLWTPAAKNFRSDESLTKAQDYLEVQQWARQSTPADAFFLPDPVHAYGWRQYSERPSYGAVRDWLYVGWIYDTRLDVFEEGLRRFSKFGLDLDQFLNLEGYRTGRRKLYAALREQYYGFETEWFVQMQNDEGIDYFIFDKTYLEGRPPPITVVFENDSYAVGVAGG